jgi:cytoskeleton protein RodZ
MGQEVRGVPEAPPLSGVPERSIGRYLARQRELRGISLEDLAGITRIPQRSLERLESGAFDRSPDGFVRGFVRTVAAALGLDPDETVMRLLSEPDDEDDARGHTSRLLVARSLAPRLAIAGAVLLAILAVWKVGAALLATPRPPADADVVLRRDPIRELVNDRVGPPAAPLAQPPVAIALEAAVEVAPEAAAGPPVAIAPEPPVEVAPEAAAEPPVAIAPEAAVEVAPEAVAEPPVAIAPEPPVEVAPEAAAEP